MEGRSKGSVQQNLTVIVLVSFLYLRRQTGNNWAPCFKISFNNYSKARAVHFPFIFNITERKVRFDLKQK